VVMVQQSKMTRRQIGRSGYAWTALGVLALAAWTDWWCVTHGSWAGAFSRSISSITIKQAGGHAYRGSIDDPLAPGAFCSPPLVLPTFA
jgi:hypothetical protein